MMNHKCMMVVMTENLNLNYHSSFDRSYNLGNPYYMKVDMPLDMMGLVRDMVMALVAVHMVVAMAMAMAMVPELDKVLHE